jgi:hypothetical protein
MPKLVLARGDIRATDELVIILSEPENEPAAVLIRWAYHQPAVIPAASARMSLRPSAIWRRSSMDSSRLRRSTAYLIAVPWRAVESN